MRHRRKGYTLIELVLVMFLLVLVSALVFSLTAAGSRAWLRLTEDRTARSELRTALSYVEVQIRKADREGAVTIEPDPFFGQPAIHLSWLIKEPTIPGLDTASTWIYLHDGALYEFYTLPGMTQSATAGRRLVTLEDWTLEVKTDNLLRIAVKPARTGHGASVEETAADESENTYIRQIYVRSGGLEP